METPRDDQLAAELRAMRPTPRPEFAAKLDERAAAGFPRRSHWPRFSFSFPKKRLLIPAGGFAVLAILVASTLIVVNDGGPEPRNNLALLESKPEPATPTPDKAGATTGGGSSPGASAANGGSQEKSSSVQYETEVPTVASEASSGAGHSESPTYDAAAAELNREVAPQIHHRAVEHSAEIVLATAPGDVGEDSSAIFEVVHAHDGIVMRSSSREGKPGEAGARFELLLPSDGLDDALAALSGIDEVRSRHEATDDITAPTVDTAELLRDSKARIDSLLAQLEAAETEDEREAVEAELRQERHHRARLQGSLQRLEHRASYSRVLVQIKTGGADESSGGGAWGVGDAMNDAGKILAVAAAVTVVALAILGPIALVALLAWLAHRAWVRRERRRVLS
jgi:hypothetical protein